jgi:NAD(P)-dependent dehydrogenase (short-subunit alcohol dehydrogenase family)
VAVHPFSRFDLTGRLALVTGGATGLGFHMARALARAGAHVLIAARREAVLREATERLNADPLIDGRASWFPVDLARRDSIRALADHASALKDGVDIFVGNAGQDFNEHLVDIKDESIDRILQVNVSANIELARAFVPGMRARRWGRFLFSSLVSTIVTSPHEGIIMYTATKGALNALTRTLAAECGHDNITANALVLGFFVTDMVRHAEQLLRETQGEDAARAFMNDFVGMTALGRAGDPAELEGLVQLLASDAGSYITGTNLVVDGGMAIMLRSNGMVRPAPVANEEAA